MCINFYIHCSHICTENLLVYKWQKQCISLSKQVDYYTNVYNILVQELGSDAARHHLSKSLFAIVIGSNDLYGYFKADSSIATKITPQDYVNSMVSAMSKTLKVKINSIEKKHTYISDKNDKFY